MATRQANTKRKVDFRALRRRLEEDMERLEQLVKQREEDIRLMDEVMATWRLQEEMRQQDEEIWREAAEQLRREAEETRQRDEESGAKRRAEQQAEMRAETDRRRHSLVQAWNNYEARWQVLPSVPFLTFRAVPWPVASNVNFPESLLPHLISEFILSPYHSHTKSRKQRIHKALIRWHSDHFDAKILHKVIEKDRRAVVEGVGRVVRCLNGMLANEGA